MNYCVLREFSQSLYIARCLFMVCCLVFLHIVGMFVPGLAKANEILDAQPVFFSQEDLQHLLIGKIQILSVLRLHATELNDLEMVELSGLAWSEDEGILYAISDHGSVFHLKPEFSGNKLSDIQLVNAFPLRGSDGEVQSWPRHDSEGLVALNTSNGVRGDDELFVSYERVPRIQRHDASGAWKGELGLPEFMQDIDNYSGGNKALEAVTVHPEYGVLTMPERPLHLGFEDEVIVYALSGKQWILPADDNELSVVAIETMPDGQLLLLRRRHRFMGAHWTVVLDRLQLHEDGQVDQERLGTLISGGDILPVDNFEGLAHHRDNRYFMISDDNNHALQDTLLVYFEVVE